MALLGYAAVLDQLQPRLVLLRRQLDDGCAQARAVLGHPASAVADARLSTLASQFDRSWDEWDAALRRCRQLLGRAAELDRDRHGWSAFGHGLVTVLSSLSPAAPLIEHPGLAGLSRALSNLGDELTVAGLVLLVVCPPAAAACFAAAAAVSAAQLVTDSTRASRHDRSVGGGLLGLDALGALPGGRLLREGETGLRAAKTLEELAPHERVTRLVPGGGLGAHEVKGHTLLKHVGKDEKELLGRLRAEPDRQLASSFYNRQIAETSISDLLASRKSKIDKWLAKDTPKLMLQGSAPASIGITVFRFDLTTSDVSGLIVILRRDRSMIHGYRIHTAFPQP
ncbi:MAG: hypothetical protein M3Y42_13740 [Actinomycetota bacterium]|nr:hypothetical protein [Actinomycetota bacterium]